MIDVGRARDLRAKGWTLQRIADEFGVTRERIRQVTVEVAVPPKPCEHCGSAVEQKHNYAPRRFCSQRCSKAAHNAKLTGSCADCGIATRGERCVRCIRAKQTAEREATYDKLVAWWAEGLTMGQIADRLGTTTNALGGLMVRARAAGWDLPRRRSNRPKGADLSKAEARQQFMSALRRGVIRRAKRCEECGEATELVEGHHVDYQRPLFVIWLCRGCHNAAHGKRTHVEAAA